MLVITFSLLLAALLSAGIIKKITYSATEKSLHQSALMISNLLSAAAATDQELDELLKTLKIEGLRITIIKSDGEVIADSEADIRLLDNHKNREEVSEAGAGKLGLVTRFSQSVSRNLLYLALPIDNFSGMDLIMRNAVGGFSASLLNLDMSSVRYVWNFSNVSSRAVKYFFFSDCPLVYLQILLILLKYGNMRDPL